MPAAGHGTHGLHEQIRGARLAQIAPGAGIDCMPRINAVVVHAEHQHTGIGSVRDDAPENFYAAHSGQRYIEHDDVRPKIGIQANGLRGGGGLADHGQLLIALQ